MYQHLNDILPTKKIKSLHIHQHGAVTYEYYKKPKFQTTLQKINSCTKNIASTLIGIALDQSLIPSLDTPIVDYFPELAGDTDHRKRQITVEHLLTMSAGWQWPELADSDTFPHMIFDKHWLNQIIQSEHWVPFALEQLLQDNPGERMNYNSGCSHLLSAIVQQASGMSTAEYAERHLFTPLGITDYHWPTDAQGIPKGGFGMSLLPEDLAKLGLLFLGEGRYHDHQILSADFVRRTIEPRYNSYPHVGSYGYHWWISPDTSYYFSMGFGGQFTIVVPSQAMVVTFTSEMPEHTLGPLKLFEEQILPPRSIT